jgi:uncharacterized protein YndB with AHSA1/START domain
MEQKTKVNAEEGRQDMTITREFNLPVDLLFKAYEEADLLEQWWGTKVLKLESKKHGSYQVQTKNAVGNVIFGASGVIHEFIPNQKIIRTFEMDNMPFGVQMEVYDFEALTDDTSKLTMHVIYETGALRDQVLKLPFTQGIGWAHNRIEELMSKQK